MARSKKNPAPTAPEEKVAVEETAVEATVEKTVSEPVVGKLETGEQPVAAPKAASPEDIQSQIRDKLNNRDVSENTFIPAIPKSLETAAEQISKEMNFEWNRGTAVGARLMARARRMK